MPNELDELLAGDDDVIVIDFSGQDDDYDAFVPDTYNVVVSKVEHGPKVKSKAGNLKMVLTFTVEDGDFKGRKLFMHPVLEGDALWSTRKTMKALGQVSEDGSIRIVPSSLMGQRARGVVDDDSAEYSSIASLLSALPPEFGDL